jgi:hypothetical protein
MNTESNPLAGLKAVQASRLRDGFTQAPLNGYVTTSGIKMDSIREDLDNLKIVRDRMAETGKATETIRDYDNGYHVVTLAELSEMIGELADFGISLYARKWQLEVELAAAESEAAVLAVRW